MLRTLGIVLALAAAASACGSSDAPNSPGESPSVPASGGPAPGDVAPAEESDDPAVADPPEPSDEPVPSAPPTLVPGCTAKSTLGGHPAWFFFSRPDKPCSGTAKDLDPHAVNELTRLIASVPKGGRIDGHIFSISVDAVAKALLDAQTRGVDVWISTDGGVAASTDPSKTDYLDKLVHKVYCTSSSRTSCISTADGAISHTKLFVFSAATAPDGTTANDVVWFGSANQTYASGERLYNNTVTVYGDTALFEKMRGYLDDLYERHSAADYYDPTSGRGHFLTDSADVYVSPESQTDIVVNRLDDVTADDQCDVRVIQASVRDSRMEVVDRLVAMHQGGCKVRVVAATVEPQALAALKAAGIPVRQKPIHDKTFIIFGKYGNDYAYRVYTGSHNLSGGSAHRYDEIFVKLAAETVAAHPVFDAYTVHFSDAYDDATPL